MRPAILAVLMLVPLAPAAPAGPVLPAGEGLAVVKKECTRCHALSHIANSEGKTREEWQAHVIHMTDIERRPANMRAVVEYLAEHFPR